MHNKMQHLDYEWSFFSSFFFVVVKRNEMNNEFEIMLTGRPAKLCQVKAISLTFAGTGTTK